MTNIYHAQPYDLGATGFYFSDYEEYCKKAKANRNDFGAPVEEYEIQFIDGENCALFNAIGVHQGNLEEWFDELEGMDEEEAIKAVYIAEHFNQDIRNILEKLDDICLFEGTAVNYAWNYLEETGLINEVPKSLQYYIDVDALARDMRLNGDIDEITINGKDYVVWGL